MTEIIIVHGYPGSGKSTQCSRLEQNGYLNTPVQHISVGDRLRSIRSGQANSAYELIINNPDAPSPLPDEVVSGALLESIHQPNTRNGLVLIDGYPRHPTAVEAFLDTLKDHSHLLLGTIAMHVSMEQSLHRILNRGQRPGEKIKADSLEAYARQRYERDHNTTRIAIEKLGEFAPVELVDASAEIDAVHHLFRQSVANLLQFSFNVE